jgi:hypothetical protein
MGGELLAAVIKWLIGGSVTVEHTDMLICQQRD